MPRKSITARKSVIAEYEERTFVNPSAVSPHLFCPICQEAFVNPQRAPCGHSFCKACLDPWLASNPNCPVDRKPVTKNSLHHDFIIESIIGDYTVACPWRALGCDFIGPLHMLESHKKGCVMNPGSMPPALRDHTTALLNKWRNNPLVVDQLYNNKNTNNKRPFIAMTDRHTATGTSTAQVSLAAGGSSATSQTDSSTSPDLSGAYCVEHDEAEADQSVVAITDDEEGALPPAPPPNLLFRLYQNSDSGSRDLLCNFLQTPSEVTADAIVAPKRRRGSGRGGRRMGLAR